MDASKQRAIALKIEEMLRLRDQGALKRSADHFISGLVHAYGIIVDEPDAELALQLARDEAARMP